MDRFQAMQVFTAVVDANSFTRAADHLNLPRTTVTTIVQGLESLLQVRLLNRTTRRISLTPDGAAYYERCVRILADVDETEASFRNVTRGPQGRLRRTGRTIDWDFMVDGVAVEVKMAGKLSVNDGDAYVASALQGFGLVQAPLYMIQSYLEEGSLVEILSQWKPVPMPISVVYLHNRHLSPKVRAFVDWVAELFATCPQQRGCQQDIEGQECRFTGKQESTTIRAVIEQQNIAENVF
jgi:DNA-binding transcriptional LysR family regulator